MQILGQYQTHIFKLSVMPNFHAFRPGKHLRVEIGYQLRRNVVNLFCVRLGCPTVYYCALYNNRSLFQFIVILFQCRIIEQPGKIQTQFIVYFFFNRFQMGGYL